MIYSENNYINTFGISFALMVAVQAVMITVIPLQAYELLGSARAVGWIYVLVSTANVIGRLFVPVLLRYIPRRQLFFVAIGLLIMASVFLSIYSPFCFTIGFLLQAIALSFVEIVLTLYMLENVGRGDLTRFEQKRLFLSAIGWFIGPWLGVALKAHLVYWAPNAAQALLSLTLLGQFGFHQFRRRETQFALPQTKPFWTHVPRYMSQPRLRLAWLLALGRATWWGMFFVYAPIFAVSAGLGSQVGGAIVSAGTLWSSTVPLWGMVARRFGMRRVVICGFAGSAILTASASVLMSVAWMGASLLVLAAAATSIIDAAGNTLFLRAVRPRERSEMMAVFISFRDFAQLLPPAIFSTLLGFFPLSVVFVSGAGMMSILTFFARYIPRSF